MEYLNKINVWVPVVWWEGLYEIMLTDSECLVRSLPRKIIQPHPKTKTLTEYYKSGKIIKADLGKIGYKTICLSLNNKGKTCYLHRLIAINFIPNPLNKPFVNHIDGNKENNSITNLEWCTSKENNNHAVKTGLINSRKLTIPQVIEIISSRKKGSKISELVDKYKISRTSIKKIIKGVSYQI